MGFKISIITATLNRKEYLPRCIESVASQSYPDKEHVIIDGGSTDGTIEVIQSYAAKYPHIKWISEKDDGLSQALNKGLALATGDAIGVIGDDDVYEANALDIIAAAFQSTPSAGVVSGNCEQIRNDGSHWMTLKASFTRRRDLIEYWRNWCRATMLPAPSTFFRREVIEAVGGFDEADRYAMDYHHWIKITEKFSVKTVDQVLSKFRCGEGTISFSSNRQQWAEMLAISQKYWGPKSSLTYWYMKFSYVLYPYWRTLRGKLVPLAKLILRR